MATTPLGALKRNTPAWPVLLLLGAVAGALVAYAQGQFFGGEIGLSVILGTVIIAPLLVRQLQGRFDVFEPLVTVAAAYLVYFAVAPLLRVVTGDVAFLGRTYEDLYARGLVFVGVAVLAMWCGYALPLGGRVGRGLTAPLALGDPGTRTLRRFGWALTVGAVTGMAVWAALANEPISRFFLPGVLTDPSVPPNESGLDIPYFFLAIEWFIPAFLLLTVSGAFRSRLMQILYFAGVVVVYLSIGFRFRLMIFVLAVAITLYLQRDRRPKPAALSVAGAGLVLLSGWVVQARTFFRSYGESGSLDFSFSNILEGALRDTRIFETFLAVLYAVPRFVDHTYLSSVTYVAILPIPRALWPEKPPPGWLDVVNPAIGTPGAVGSGAFVPHFGEYYLAFGWLGMLVGMTMFGVACRVLWSWYRTDAADRGRQVVFAISNVFLVLVIIRGYLAQIVMEWCFIILPALIALFFARRAARNARRAAVNA